MATEKFIAYHEYKAKGGGGLIITEDYAVTPTAGGFKSLDWREDGQIESYKELTRRPWLVKDRSTDLSCRERQAVITGEQPVGPSMPKRSNKCQRHQEK